MRLMARRVLVVALPAVSAVSAVSALGACSKDDQANLIAKTVDAAPPPPPGPKSLDLAKAALVTAKAKHAKHEATDADCGPLQSLKADFAKDTSPDAVKTAHEIHAFCEIDVALEGAVTTLKADNEKLSAALKKKDKTTEQMYAATVKDGCANVRKQLDSILADHLDGEPKVATLKAEIEPICNPPSAAKKK